MNTSTISRLTIMMLIVTVLVAITSALQPAHAAGPWYVAPSGNDSNSCTTPGAPCASINGVLNKSGFVAGDTVLVATGVYTGTGDQVVLLDKTTTLSGGWSASFTTQNGASTIDGEGARRGMTVNYGVTAIVDRFVVQNCSSEAGAGIHNTGNLTLNNSTVSNNTAIGEGGGIFNSSSSTLTLNSSTISDNKAFFAGGITTCGGPTLVRNTIVAGNTARNSPDCYNVINSAGYNLIGDTSNCSFILGSGDLTNVDAGLGPLIGAPGQSKYHPLLSGSPAINAGNPAGCMGSSGPLTTDQRGAARVGRCDIGAYEYTIPGLADTIFAFAGTPQHTPPLNAFRALLQVGVLDSIGSPVNNSTVTFFAPVSGASGTFSNTGTFTTTTVTNESGIATAATFTANGVAGSYVVTATVSTVVTQAIFYLSNLSWYVTTDGNNGNDCLSPATACATIDGALNKPDFVAGDTIRVATGAYTGTGDQVVLLDKNVILSGGWDAGFTTQSGASTIDGQGARRGIMVNIGVIATIEHFAIRNCLSSGYGGGIFNRGALTLNNSVVTNNTASNGGGVYGGDLILNNTVINGNEALDTGYSSAGGIIAGGILTLNRSAITGNGSNGIYALGGKLTLNNSTVSANHDRGINNEGSDCVLTLNNATVTGNGDVGIAQGMSAITLTNSIIAGNNGQDCLGTSGVINSGGYNIIGNIAGCNFNPTTGDLTNVDAKLGPLEGSPGYHPLLPGSPAINAGNPAGCIGNAGLLTIDQRGLPRFGRCDIGAYELQPLGFSFKTTNKSAVPAGDTLTYSIVLTNPGAINLTNVRVTDTLPSLLSYKKGSLDGTSGSYGYSSQVITWSGVINTGAAVTITFGATVSPTLGLVANSAVISGGGEILTRTAVISVEGKICQVTKYIGNPVLSVGLSGSWDDEAVWQPTVLKEGSSYKMWYTASDGSTRRIGYATSPDGLTWTKYGNNPILSPSLSWESNGVFAPTVISDTGLYKMWYTGVDADGITQICRATSPDGITWTKYGLMPGFESLGSWEDQGVAEPTVFKLSNTYHLWYRGYDGMTSRIGHATSSDGVTWVKDAANPVLDAGSPGAWDWLSVYGPSVVKVGAGFILWYSGGTLPPAWQTGYALSSDGSAWTRGEMLIPEGTLSAFDADSADYPSLMVEGDRFKAWYSGLNNSGDYTIGYANAEICSSTPPSNPIYLPIVLKGSSPCPAYYADNFNNPNSGWPVGDNINRRYAYVDGQYQIWVKQFSQGWFATPGAKATDFTAAVSARRTSGTWGQYGILFGINEDWSQYYQFGIDGPYYSLWRYDGSWTALKDWTQSNYIGTSTAWNRLKVVRNGSSIAVYANNQLLTTVTDSSLTGLRRIGLVAYSPNNASLDARFDDFSLYPASCGMSAYAVSSDAAQFEIGQPEVRQLPSLPRLPQH